MTPRLPRIGINCDHFSDAQTRLIGLREPYVRAVLAAGGTPVMFPFLETAEQVAAALDGIDGFVLTGGDDLRAERLRTPLSPASTPVAPDRDRSDFMLIEALIARRIPALAICLGCQELNIHLGGTIYQDLPSELPASAVIHRGPVGTPEQYVAHELKVEPDTLLSALWGRATKAQANSSHHQAIRDLGRGLKKAAGSPDGLTEAVELAGHPFFLGVQWHPERLDRDPLHRALFSALVLEAGSRIGKASLTA